MITNYFEGLFESMLIISFFCLIYLFIFNKEASFKQNRFFLSLGLVLSATLPFINIPVSDNTPMLYFADLTSIEVYGYESIDKSIESSFKWINVFHSIYFIGVFYFLSRFLYQLAKISSFYRKAEVQKKGNVNLVYTGKKHSVFSFFNSIFIDSTSATSADLDIIINHERVHITQKHSIDLLLFGVLAIVQWFNPFVWLYRKIIKQNHEFLADKGLLKKGLSLEKYQEVLLQNYSFLSFGLTNSFNHSLTFKRLIMMKKNSSNKSSLLKIVLILPIVIVISIWVSCSKELQNLTTQDELTVETVKSKTADGEEIFMIVKEMPQFPGGELGLRKYIADNVKYPKAAADSGISGKVYVRFAVMSTGKVEKVVIARGVHQLLDEEAMRVISKLPDWTPGKQKGKAVNVWYTIPINFALDNANDKTIVITTKDGETIKLKNPEDAKNYDVENIEKIKVLKNADRNTEKVAANNGEIVPVLTEKVKEILEAPKYDNEKTTSDNEKVFLIVEEMPKFEGGHEGLKNFITNNLKYPEEAKKNGVTGKVYVRFAVNKEGMVEKSEIARGVSPSLDAEALRVINSLPKWTPGKQKGKPVAVYYTVPIKFALK